MKQDKGMELLRVHGGLIFAIAGVVVCVATLIITSGKFVLTAQIALALSVMGLAVYALLNPKRVQWLVKRKIPAYSRNILISVFAVLLIVFALNYVAFLKPLQWDLTESKSYSLSQNSKDILKQLKAPITIQAFFSAGYASTASAERLLDSYLYNAPEGMFSYEVIDPDANPLLAQQANVLKDGTLVLSMDDRSEQVTYPSEQEVSSAILRLLNPQEKTIYFLTGHGEYDPSGTEDLSYGFVQQALTAKNFAVNQINLLTESQIPDDAAVIVIAGPQKSMTEDETALLSQYVESGGSLVVLLEPTLATDITLETDPLIEYLQTNYGIDIHNDVILDPYVSPPVIAIAEYYGEHPITEKLATTVTIFPTSTSLSRLDTDASGDVNLVDLILTSDSTWGETSEDEIMAGEPVNTSEEDYQGPLLLAVASANINTGSRMVLVGDSDFASNAYFQEYANGDLIMNSIEWAAGDDELINLSADATVNRILLPPSTLSLGAILLVTVFVLPAVFIVAGIVTLVKQRKTM